MSNKKHCQNTDLVCKSCGNVTSIQRCMAKLKSSGHIKDLWCFSCQEVTKHYEVNNISVFMFDYDSKSEEEKIIYDLVKSRRENGGKKRERVLKKISTHL